MKKILIVVIAVFVSACASTVEPTSAPAPTATPAPSSSGTVEVPTHPFAGKESPGTDYTSNYSWGSTDPDSCVSSRFVRGDAETGGRAFVTDSMTALQWGAGEALYPSSAVNTSGFGDSHVEKATLDALCAAQYAGTRAATKAEIDEIAKAVPNCPLPGAFYSVDLWNMMTEDGSCIDLKTDTDTGTTAATCPAVDAKDGDIARALLCVK